MVRLKDIAIRAGVSVMTVSKALRDEPDISATTKARLKQLAQQMGYVPDTFAQALRTRDSKLLGLVISSITNPIYARIILAIEERAHELGYEVILAQSLGTMEREETCVRRLLARRVQGIFIAPVYRMPTQSPVYQLLLAQRMPTLILGHLAPFCASFPNVETDDIAASRAVTEHLLQLGHRRIAYFCGPVVSPTAQERYEGYRRALREADIDVDDKWIFQAGTTIEDGEKAALQMINESTQATAVQTANDLVAIGAADTFLKQGLKIPQDLSLAGFGNILTSEYFRVPLTTYRQPKFSLGNAAMDSMLDLLRHGKTKPKRLSGDLIVRASTAAPPSPPAAK
jgi:LacI family transcriptional regulator, repressor for deo operon, udp, cdd, tsx, nupC, and nupG